MFLDDEIKRLKRRALWHRILDRFMIVFISLVLILESYHGVDAFLHRDYSSTGVAVLLFAVNCMSLLLVMRSYESLQQSTNELLALMEQAKRLRERYRDEDK